MTDKEKLEKLVSILIKRLYMHKTKADIGSTEKELFDEKNENAQYEECKDILNIIDSMQEEPVSDTQSPVVFYGLTGSVGNTKEEPQVIESAEIQHVNETCKENGDSLTQEEDLKEAAKHYLYSNILYDDVYVGNPTEKDCIEMFKAGAKWQEEKDDEEKVLTYRHGFKDCKEQMMKDAIRGHVGETSNGLLRALSDVFDDELSLMAGDKVKMILIREE